MKHRLLAIVLLLSALMPQRGGAAPSPLTPDCRYLFVVDTSLSMTRLQPSVTAALQRMVMTGLDGQMSPGEVFTIWTFNESVFQRDYPLNSWRPELNQSMGNRVRQFMESQRYQRKPNMRALLNALNQARQICPRIAIFLISDGEEVLVGTPFDRNVNVSYGRRFAELRAARVPFLTTLVCENGQFVSWAVSAANEPVTIPHGPDGNLVVGRPKQINTIGPTPVMTTNQAPVPITTPPSNNIGKSAAPVTPVSTNRSVAQPTPSRPGVITLPGPPPTARKVVELTPKSRQAEESRVVKPTDIAPSAKRPSPVFRKTNSVADATAKVEPKTKTIPVAKAAAPPPPRSSATMTVKSAKRPPSRAATTPAPSPAALATKAVPQPPAPEMPKPAVPKREPEVVIQVVTQIVMVPLPAITPEKTVPAPAAPPVTAEPKAPEPEPTPIVKSNAPPSSAPAVTEVAVVEAPETNAPAIPAPSPPPAVSPAPPSPAPEPGGLASLLGPNHQNTIAWLFLAGGILALLVVIAGIRRLVATRSGESSMISQSMERRDNG